MMKQCTAEMIIDILEERVGVPSTTPFIHTASWEALGVESLGLTEVYSNLEQALNIAIPEDQASDAQNVQELAEMVNGFILSYGYASN